MSLRLEPVNVSTSIAVEQRRPPLTGDARWHLALRVSESPSFANAPLLARFLLFVCERTIANRLDDLTERNIGIEVFHRRPDFKTSEDNIVRSYVRQLRQRLEKYFEEHQADEPLRILIPRGGYSAVFELQPTSSIAEPAAVLPPPPTAVASNEATAPPEPPSRTGWIVGVVIAVGIVCSVGWTVMRGHRLEASPAHVLWAELFSSSMPTYIVSADSGLVVMEELSGKPATLQQYMDGSYFAQFEKASTPQEITIQRLSRERYTGVPDIDTAVALAGLPEAHTGNVTLRNARAFTLDDTKDANLIFMGSNYSTPWVALYEPSMNFRFHFDASVYSSWFENTQPQPEELARYQNGSTAPPFLTYAVIALVPNPNGSGKTLIIEGLTTAGTEAASAFLMHKDMATFLSTVPRDQHGLHAFELLLKTTNLDSNASNAEIVASRIH